MLKQTIAILALTTSIGLPATLTVSPQPAQAMCAAATKLTGTWQANDGGTYTIRQVGNTVTWQGKSRDGGKTWNHIFRGSRSGDIITGTWIDQPSGQIQSRGRLKLKVKRNGTAILGLTRLEATGGFGGSNWYQPCDDVESHGVSE
jgi:hypothetical protein